MFTTTENLIKEITDRKINNKDKTLTIGKKDMIIVSEVFSCKENIDLSVGNRFMLMGIDVFYDSTIE